MNHLLGKLSMGLLLLTLTACSQASPLATSATNVTLKHLTLSEPAVSDLMFRPEHPGNTHEPLRPGTRLVYQTNDGDEFVREVYNPVDLIWFDGNLLHLTPVWDDRYGGFFLFQTVQSEIRVVGSYHEGRLERWGEYILVITPLATAVAEPIITPAGQFDQAKLMVDTYGQAWYASGIGLIRTETFELVAYSHEPPRQIDL